MKSLGYISWLVLIVSFLAWGAVAYAGMWLVERAREEGKRAMSAEAQASSAAYLSRLQALSLDTKADREQLEAFVRSDIVALASGIEKAGRDVGVRAKVNSAQESGGTDIPGGDSLKIASFMIQAEGSFSGLVRLVKVLEKYPAFSSIEQFEFDQVGEPGSAAGWRANIRLHIHTTSNISS